MKEIFSKLSFFLTDVAVIFLSLLFAYSLRDILPWFTSPQTYPLEHYLTMSPLYIFILVIFFYEGIYSKRYDFWHETRLILKGLFFAFIFLYAYLALSKSVHDYSRFVLLFSFSLMAWLIPIFKRVMKFLFYRLGLWQRQAKIYGQNDLLIHEIFSNPYLGYVQTSESPQTIFINSKAMKPQKLQETLESQIKECQEIIFIPILNEFDLTQSHIYALFNVQTNLISLQNRLKSKWRRTLKYSLDFVSSLILLPFLAPLMLLIAWKIRQAEPDGTILYRQKRVGKDGKLFTCYKFRTMHENGSILLKEYLQKHPEEEIFYKKYHKYKKDPRITPIGSILRTTSLDELPQIFNVLKGEMSLVGPRPYLPDEIKNMENQYESIIQVRPGITGMWQVNGRNSVSFHERMAMDIWYIRNWSLWVDIVILVKTIKVVWARKGVY